MNNPLIERAILHNYYLKFGYQSREKPEYCLDLLQNDIWQPQVYVLARYLGMTLNCKYVIDIGCGMAYKLSKMYPDFQIIGIDYGVNIDQCRDMFPHGTWIEHDLNSPQRLPIPESILKHSIIVCADVIEHLVHPAYLLNNLQEMLEHAAACLLSTPERDLERGFTHYGPPPNPSHVREWTLYEITDLFRSLQFNITYKDLTVSDNISNTKKTSLLVLGNNNRSDYRAKLLDTPEVWAQIERII